MNAPKFFIARGQQTNRHTIAIKHRHLSNYLSKTMFSEILSNPQLMSKLWTTYVVISIVALLDLVNNNSILIKRVEELEHKYAAKLHFLSEQEVRMSELEKRHAIISQNVANKMDNVFYLANSAIMRVEQMDQTLKTHIIETAHPKSSPKAIATQTVEMVEDDNETESPSPLSDENVLFKINDRIDSETRERRRLTEITYNILYDLLRVVYQGTQELGTRLSNLNRAFWNKDVVQNVLEPETMHHQ